MPPASDLHPDDVAARLGLRATLCQLRRDSGVSARDVAREAGFPFADAIGALERASSWEARRVQQWARGLHHRLFLDLEGVEVAADDTVSVVLRAVTTFGALDEDQAHLRLLAHDLRRTREARGVTRVEFAGRCGVHENTIRWFDNRPLTGLLRSYQRYARALGGSIGLRLEPVGVMAV